MKGRTGYFINNIEGRPFFYILSDEYKGFREFLYEIAENLRQIRTGATVDKLIMVFDRGGYGEELCNDMKHA